MTDQRTRDEFEQTMEIEREAPLVPAITPNQRTPASDADVRRELSALRTRLDRLEAAIQTRTENQ